MRVLRDFICEDGHITERLIDSSIEYVSCGTCGKQANKTLGYGTLMLDGTDPAFPGAYDKWARIREDRHKQMAKKR